MEKTIIHDENKCSSCGACIDNCYRKNFYRSDDKMVKLHENSMENCILCGHCLAGCSSEGALKIEGYNSDSLSRVKPSPAPEVIGNFILSRRSIRRFTDDIPSESEIDALLEAGCYAPTGHNSQDCNFVVIKGHKKVKVLGEIAVLFYEGLLNKMNNPVLKHLVKLSQE